LYRAVEYLGEISNDLAITTFCWLPESSILPGFSRRCLWHRSARKATRSRAASAHYRLSSRAPGRSQDRQKRPSEPSLCASCFISVRSDRAKTRAAVSSAPPGELADRCAAKARASQKPCDTPSSRTLPPRTGRRENWGKFKAHKWGGFTGRCTYGPSQKEPRGTPLFIPEARARAPGTDNSSCNENAKNRKVCSYGVNKKIASPGVPGRQGNLKQFDSSAKENRQKHRWH
jgi:hypothetical protein